MEELHNQSGFDLTVKTKSLRRSISLVHWNRNPYIWDVYHLINSLTGKHLIVEVVQLVE